jgi:hypothetical protein
VEKTLLIFEDIRTKAKCDDWTGKLRLRKLRRALNRNIIDGRLSEVRSHKQHQFAPLASSTAATIIFLALLIL